MYAGIRGAFIDLAADLAWLTGRAPATLVLDEHCTLPHASETASVFTAAWLVDRATGVLLEHGYTPEDAERELLARAARLGVDLHGSARDIIGELTATARAPHVEVTVDPPPSNDR
jgi:hypothetical protein